MKKRLIAFAFALLLLVSVPAFSASAATRTVQHTVIKGESLWLIAVKYKVGLSEIISANSQIKNPALIYPKQIINVPLTDTGVTSFEEQVANLVNDARKQNGLQPLKLNWELSRIARYKSQDMHDKKYFSHQSPTYGSPFDMIKSFGISYRAAGENIAMGQRTPAEVMNSWMNSSGHRANILNASFTQIGVGYVASGNYWTQTFIG